MKPQKFPQQKTYFYLTPLAAALSIGLFSPQAFAVTCQAGFTASNPDSSYTDNGDGTVTHTPTGLVWKRCQEGQTWSGGTCTGSATSHTWSQALTLAATTNHAGQTDWRLPNIQELTSLLEECRVNPSINDTIFPNTPASDVWSGSPNAGNASYAWYVYFSNGDSSYVDGRNGNSGVRLVRGGQSLAPLTSVSSQTITFGTAPNLAYGGGTGLVSATATSNLAVTLSSLTTNVCSITGTTITPITAGTCTIAADQAGNTSYSVATRVTQDIVINKANQTIVLGALPTVAVGSTGTITVVSSGASGNPVTYSTTSPNCSVTSAGVVTGIAAGACSIAVNQAGNENYNAGTVSLPITAVYVPPPTPTPTPTPTPSPTPAPAPAPDSAPYTPPTAPTNGSVRNAGSAGVELLIIGGNTAITAGKGGASLSSTSSGGITTLQPTSGTVDIPCSAAGNFCKAGQTTLPVLTGESVKFTADGKVSSIEITPSTPSSTLERLNGKSLMDAVVETLQANIPALGAETGRNASDWNTLGVGFASGQLSVTAQLPMQVNPALPDGVRLLPNGSLQVSTQGVMVNLNPSLLDTSSFTAALHTLNPNAQARFGNDGTIGITYNEGLYSLRPSLFTATPDNSQFTVGSDGVLRFGNQTIPPATYNFDQFSTMLANLDPTARVSIQVNGKLVVQLKGVEYTLTPDYQVFIATTPNSIGFTIRDGKLVVNYQFGFSQGFTVGK